MLLIEQLHLQLHLIGQLQSTGQLHSTDAFLKDNLDKNGMLLVLPLKEQIVFATIWIITNLVYITDPLLISGQQTIFSLQESLISDSLNSVNR